ncbi:MULTISPECIES: hypothetical protein [Mycolicibacter]|uniref:Uncharacterized protein n=2 Tax=Mycolicibacter TaxID=1073531 RepID=A0ABU5XL37_9MYCO|nr:MULTISPECIES: hypothetical protein [unclassified Mycolicibacter]MEB3023000.1 hypothetical protein [Mycolicibacter sp. MYC098]MEB3033510.1 hypothetical protein [Mycolicibacter sp. MYC340]
MSDPTMHNRLYAAGWDTFARGDTFEPEADPVVREYAAGLSVGDQLAAEIRGIWSRGFRDAREEASVDVGPVSDDYPQAEGGAW